MMTNLNLVKSSKYSNIICFSCDSEFSKFRQLRATILERQQTLYILHPYDKADVHNEVLPDRKKKRRKDPKVDLDLDDEFVLDIVKQEINGENRHEIIKESVFIDENPAELLQDFKVEDEFTEFKVTEVLSVNSNEPPRLVEKLSYRLEKEARKTRMNEKKIDQAEFEVCPICSVKIASEKYLKKHIETVHSSDANPQNENQSVGNVCPYCDVLFSTKRIVLKHVGRKHPRNLKVFKENQKLESKQRLSATLTQKRKQNLPEICEICDLEFANENLLSKHIKSAHSNIAVPQDKEEIFPCPYCHAELSTRQCRHKHVSRKHPENEEEYRENQKLELQKRYKKSSRTAASKLNDRAVTTNSESVIEIKVEVDESNNVIVEPSQICNIVKLEDNEIVPQRKQTKHFRKPPPQKFSCDHCGFECKRKARMQVHILYELDRRGSSRHVCPHCNKNFLTYKNFSTHIQNYHKKPQGIYFCDVCNAHYKSKYNLKEHLLKKHAKSEPSVLCHICSKTFITIGFLSTHMRVSHSTEQNFFCFFCPRKLSTRPFLDLHLRNFHATQDVKNSLQCLDQNEEGHTKCTFHGCELEFDDNASRKNHIRTHYYRVDETCEKIDKHGRIVPKDHKRGSHRCDMCPATYTWPNYLLRHKEAHHYGYRYHCVYPGCKIEMCFKKDLKGHLKEKHRLSKNEIETFVEAIRNRKHHVIKIDKNKWKDWKSKKLSKNQQETDDSDD